MNEHRARATIGAGTKLAFQRTFLAHERTQLAWLRSALSMISFGFAISKFFEYLRRAPGHREPATSPRTVGILMIVIGLSALLVASLQHWRALKALREQAPELPKSLAAAAGWLIALLGFVALLATMFRL